MRTFLRSDLVRRFLGGFVLGAIALMVMQPANALSGAVDPASAASTYVADAGL